MRNLISYSALAVALTAGASVSVAQAQTVDTVIAPAPAPVQTVETVRTVQSTTTPRRHVVRHDRVTTTRTTVTERIVPAPVPPAAAAIAQPTYTEVVQSPYPRLYDVATPAPGAFAPGAAPDADLPLRVRARSHSGDRPVHQHRGAGDPALTRKNDDDPRGGDPAPRGSASHVRKPWRWG